MRKPKITMIVPVGILVLMVGCGQLLTTSAIPAKLDTEALILAAGKTQGIKLSSNGERGSSQSQRSRETERHFHATLSSGTRGQFVAAYRDQVRRLIETAGATINGSGLSGTETDTVDFSYDYDWRGNAGIVRVYSFGGTNGDVQIISLCYEHR